MTATNTSRSGGHRNRGAVIAILILCTVSLTPAQTPYQVPFGTRGNTIELLLENSTPGSYAEMTIQAVGLPSWIVLTPAERIVKGILPPGKSTTATFSFDIDKSAPVGTVQALRFVVSGPTGEIVSKSIPISVLPPERFELLQNYPNPFNPTTTIGFTIPRKAGISLKVFNMLGEEVATLAEGSWEAGYHEVEWEANAAASGVYLYRLSSAGSALSGKMIVLR